MNKILHIAVTDRISLESDTIVIRMESPGHAPIYYTDWIFSQSFPDFIGSVVSTKPSGVRFNTIVLESAQDALVRLQASADLFAVFVNLVMSFPAQSRQLGFSGAYSEQYQSTYDALSKAVFDDNNKEVRVVHHPSRRRHHIEHISNAGSRAGIWHHLHHGARR